MLEGMAEQIRVQVYEGLYRSQSEDYFEADATEAAKHGWFPTGQTWTGSRLTVSYAYRTRSRQGPSIQGAGGAKRTLPTWSRVVYWTVILGTVLAATLLLVAFLVTQVLDRQVF